jgi:dolichyl-phosphate beta-glucosyltransferase
MVNGPPSHPVLVAIPVHDEGPLLADFLGQLAALAPPDGAPATRLVVVDDGSRPEAARVQAEAVAEAAGALAAAGSPHAVELVRAPVNRGKGAAIRLGWGDGRGARWLGFVDGDGAVPAAEVWRLASLAVAGEPAAALLGARLRGAGRRVERTPLRDLQGRAFAAAVRATLGLRLRDPQCGLKLFRAERLAPHLGALREERWLLDLELLLQLTRAGDRLEEIPIDWRESSRSKVIAAVDPFRMLLGLLRLRRRLGTARRKDP